MELHFSPDAQRTLWARVTGMPAAAPLPPPEMPEAPVLSLLGTCTLCRRLPFCVPGLYRDCAVLRARWYLRTGAVLTPPPVSVPRTFPALLREILCRREREIALLAACDWLDGETKTVLCAHGREQLRLLTGHLEACFR